MLLSLYRKLTRHLFFRFAMVGGVGFCVDGGILQFGLSVLDWGPIVARVPSFFAAVLTTWYLNRSYTFEIPHKSFIETFPGYLSANFVGLLLNFGIYSAAVIWLPDTLGKYPLVALAVGGIIAMFFNYAISRHFIFVDKKVPQDDGAEKTAE